MPKDRDFSEVPLAQRRPPAKPLAEYVSLYPDRDRAIAAAYDSDGYTPKAIGNHVGRPLRIEFPGGLYHITSPGDAREDID